MRFRRSSANSKADERVTGDTGFLIGLERAKPRAIALLAAGRRRSPLPSLFARRPRAVAPRRSPRSARTLYCVHATLVTLLRAGRAEPFGFFDKRTSLPKDSRFAVLTFDT